MKIRHIKPNFSFKPRLPNSIKKDYDNIFTEILTKDKPTVNTDDNQFSNKICSSYTFNANKPEIKKIETGMNKVNPSQSNNNSYIDYTLTTTKYVTQHQKSFLIPTVIAVISKTDKTYRFEKKTSLSEKRNRRLLEKNTTHTATADDKDKRVAVIDIDTLSEEIKDLSVVIGHKKTEDFNNIISDTLVKAPSNLINQIRSRIKKNKTCKV